MNEETVARLMCNPFNAITIDPVLAEPHEPLIDESQWVQINASLIEQIGVEPYLQLLLDVLKGGYVGGLDERDDRGGYPAQ